MTAAPAIPRYSPANLTVVTQIGHADCAVACLAMIAHVSHMDALTTASRHSKIEKGGMWNKEIADAARALGVRVRRVRARHIAWTYPDEFGIVLSNDSRDPRKGGHAVVLWNRLVIDPSYGTLWEPEDYFKATKQKPTEFIRVTRGRK